MMIKRVHVLAPVCLLLSGCLAPPTRPISLEMNAPEGSWRLEGVQSATLDMVGWQVRILESKVRDGAPPPTLEVLIVEIVNTSPDEPLVLEPLEITLAGIGHSMFLGPPKPVVLGQNESQLLFYDPGVGAPLLMYPFALNVTVFRGLNFKSPQSVSIKMY